MEYPKLNPVEGLPVEYRGQKLICLRDPRNINGKAVFVSPTALLIIQHFDGKHSIIDIQKSYMERFRSILFRDEITKLINQLDESLLLQSEHYLNHQRRIEEEFDKSVFRESSHAGLSYPQEREELVKWLNSFFEKANQQHPTNSENGKITGLISPHIDFKRGGTSYALAYKELIDDTEADIYIIFGTSHYANVANPFILTRKNFKTPFGEIETDVELIEKLTKSSEWNLFEGEIAHLTEHSIEFQLVFLQYLFGNRKQFKILPILCNSFNGLIQNGNSPKDDVKVFTFLKAINGIIKTLGDRVFIIAGADLAHVGQKFGDTKPVSESTLRWIKERDLLSLSFTEQIDADGFYRCIEEENDKRKICRLSPIYCLLSTINAKRGKLIDYDQALEPDTGSVVSFASVGFYC
ncbi:MAG: AmmeMemoRadiSam system protein B [Deltaproteobacteria bacterium]|nr:AmmeMemoRadiSam system protein B [Deltaproteobacteria bacterium]